MGTEDSKSLELRLAEIEKKLDALATRRTAVASLSKDEIEAYRKVRDVLAADWGDFCGINDCFRCVQLCARCVTTRCIVRCINECVCGPCNLGGGIAGGLGRFEGLGG